MCNCTQLNASVGVNSDLRLTLEAVIVLKVYVAKNTMEKNLITRCEKNTEMEDLIKTYRYM
jgi:hypothetical protein